jgi:periplasmic protein CpxP/Spy
MTVLSNTFSSRPVRLLAATLLIAAAGGFALSVSAAPPSHGGISGPMVGGMGGSFMGGPARVEHMLDFVNASAEQRSQITAILSSARADLKAQHEAARPLHEQMAQLFQQPTVDARAAEALRQQAMTQYDQASQRVLQAMLEVSRVLTVEQRKQIADQAAQRRTQMERRWSERQAQPKATN